MATRPVSSQLRRKSQPTFLCLCVQYMLAFCKCFTQFMCFKFILHFRILIISLYMYGFQFAPLPFWGVHVCQLMQFLLSHDFTLRDIRIKEYIYWPFKRCFTKFSCLKCMLHSCFHVISLYMYYFFSLLPSILGSVSMSVYAIYVVAYLYSGS